MRFTIHAFVVFIAISLLFSCASPKDVIYFQDISVDTSLQSIVSHEVKYEAGDKLFITVSAPDLMSVQLFNLPIINMNPFDGRATGTYMQQSYLVQTDGTIDFPVLGKIQVAGKTRVQLRDELVLQLTEYVKNPIVNISMANFMVTVMGEVTRPGTFSITNEKITLLEAIGLAGDLQITGKRNQILVIREAEGQKQIYRVDLRSRELLNSPVYYLKQNDVVYVEPNAAKVNSANYNPTAGILISAASLIITLATLVVNIIK